MNQIEIRYGILEGLYDNALKTGLHRSKVTPELMHRIKPDSVPESEFFFSLNYLKEKKLIGGLWNPGAQQMTMEITTDGVDFVEFYRLGISMTQQGKGADFENILKRITSSGIRVVEESLVSMINIAVHRMIL